MGRVLDLDPLTAASRAVAAVASLGVGIAGISEGKLLRWARSLEELKCAKCPVGKQRVPAGRGYRQVPLASAWVLQHRSFRKLPARSRTTCSRRSEPTSNTEPAGSFGQRARWLWLRLRSSRWLRTISTGISGECRRFRLLNRTPESA